jgi:hypothetical protein
MACKSSSRLLSPFYKLKFKVGANKLFSYLFIYLLLLEFKVDVCNGVHTYMMLHIYIVFYKI